MYITFYLTGYFCLNNFDFKEIKFTLAYWYLYDQKMTILETYKKYNEHEKLEHPQTGSLSHIVQWRLQLGATS